MIPAPTSPTPALSDEPQAAPPDLIFIEGLRLETIIGIHTSELHHTQTIVVDLQAGLPRAEACDTDRIADTIDYSVVRERLLRLAGEHRLQLLEAFAETVATILLVEFGAAWVRVKVVKPHKFPDLQAVGVQIERRAAPRERARPAKGVAVLHLIGSGMVPPRGR